MKLELAGPKAGTYESGVALKTEGEGKKAKSKKARKKRKSIPCNCGGAKLHYYRTSKHCLKRDLADATTPSDAPNKDSS